MRILACGAATAASLTSSVALSLAPAMPAWAQPKAPATLPASASPGMPAIPAAPGRHTAETAVYAPEIQGAFLSLALPGAGQYYAGNPIKAAGYLGLGTVAWISIYQTLIALIATDPNTGKKFVSDVSIAFAALIGYAGFLGVGGLSTLDAMADISGRYQAAEEALVPRAGIAAPALPVPRRRKDDE